MTTDRWAFTSEAERQAYNEALAASIATAPDPTQDQVDSVVAAFDSVHLGAAS